MFVFQAGEMVIFQDRDGPNFPGGVEGSFTGGRGFSFSKCGRGKGGIHFPGTVGEMVISQEQVCANFPGGGEGYFAGG